MEESRVRDVVKSNSEKLTQILKEACGNNTGAMETFLRFTLNEASDERQIASSKKFVYDIAIVVINAMQEMVREEKSAARNAFVADE